MNKGLAIMGVAAVAAVAAVVGKRKPSPFAPDEEDFETGQPNNGPPIGGDPLSRPPVLLPPTPVATTLAQVIGRVVAAAASRDPAVMRAEAKRLRAEGWPAQAGDLEEAARRIESLQPVAPRPAPVVVNPPVVTPEVVTRPPAPSPSPLPGIIPVSMPAPVPVPVAAPVVAPAVVAAVVAAVMQGPRVLKLGMSGPDVKALQVLLNVNGAGLVEDGAFGPATDNATRALQKARGITVDGIVGPETLAAIAAKPIAAKPIAAAAPVLKSVDPTKWRKTLSLGMVGPDVGEWQLVLQRDGYLVVTVDDKFGPQTKAVTMVWQRKNGLTTDGMVGPATRAKILARPARVAGDVVAGDFLPLRAASPLPGIIAMQVPTEQVAPERALAAKLAQHLQFAELGAEDRNLISLFQTTNGLNPTGAYGRATAEALIGFGFVPPRVRYWPSKGTLHSKARYRAALQAQAKLDPQRALEWGAAANQVEN